MAMERKELFVFIVFHFIDLQGNVVGDRVEVLREESRLGSEQLLKEMLLSISMLSAKLNEVPAGSGPSGRWIVHQVSWPLVP